MMHPMSLRVRLVAALALLLTVGLALFGFATYNVYARLQHQRLDDNLQQAVRFAGNALLRDDGGFGAAPRTTSVPSATTDAPATGNPGTARAGDVSPVDGPGRLGPPDIYAALLNADGSQASEPPTF